jgi:hypothetical protein
VSLGYSPLAPAEARFNTSRDLHLRFPAVSGSAVVGEPVITHVAADPLHDTPDPLIFDHTNNGSISYSDDRNIEQFPQPIPPIRGSRRLRRIGIFMLLIVLFGGALYGTGLYLRGTNLWAGIHNPFRTQTATANVDINLRAEPNATSDVVGYVTKNSKLKIVNSQNNWYQVDIIQQGRDRTGGPNATHGWLNGKYIDIDGN